MQHFRPGGASPVKGAWKEQVLQPVASGGVLLKWAVVDAQLEVAASKAETISES